MTFRMLAVLLALLLGQLNAGPSLAQTHAQTTKPPKPPAGNAARPKRDATVGTITAVKCASPAKMDLTLKDNYGRTPVLHSENYFKVDFLTLHWNPPDPFHPCEHINGRLVRVVYTPVDGKPYAGEVISVEIIRK